MLGDHFGADKLDTQKCTLYIGPTHPPPASAKDVGGLGSNRRVGRIPRGTQFTCFTSTKVQILTAEELLEDSHGGHPKLGL
jgi:hypothetical protein